MEIILDSTGAARCVYGEEIDLLQLGHTEIRRASHVEPDAAGQWWADLVPVAGPKLGPYSSRGLAIIAEMEWLKDHWLTR